MAFVRVIVASNRRTSTGTAVNFSDGGHTCMSQNLLVRLK